VISVVIPVRNDAAHLRACLARLQASTHTDYEVVVVDDASTDDETGEAAREMGVRVLRLDKNLGPAGARNRGAQSARGEHLFFIDADVCVHPETVGLVAAAFASDPTIDALFGSYDRTPGAGTLLAQYKNLFHHFVHQQGAYEASTFWTGCGAIKRSVFLEMGGFDESYSRPCIEDIELGARLRRSSHRTVLRKEIQATHLKKWTLWGILKSDVLDRGIPWTELILRERNLPNDLNLRFTQRLAALIACALAGTILLGAWFHPAILLLPLLVLLGIQVLDSCSAGGRVNPLAGILVGLVVGAAVVMAVRAFGWWSLLPAGLVLAIVAINLPFYAFFARERHPLFALFVIPLHVLYYLYSGAALVLGTGLYLWKAKVRPVFKVVPGTR